MELLGSSCIFPTPDIQRTAAFYQEKLGFRAVAYLESDQPHICLYRDGVEIILTQADSAAVKPNRILYGYGYDAYLYTCSQAALQETFRAAGVKLVKPLARTDYGNTEFVLEDIDGRWLAFGLKE